MGRTHSPSLLTRILYLGTLGETSPTHSLAPLESFTLALELDWIGLKLTASILRERFAAFVLDGF